MKLYSSKEQRIVTCSKVEKVGIKEGKLKLEAGGISIESVLKENTVFRN